MAYKVRCRKIKELWCRIFTHKPEGNRCLRCGHVFWMILFALAISMADIRGAINQAAKTADEKTGVIEYIQAMEKIINEVTGGKQ